LPIRIILLLFALISLMGTSLDDILRERGVTQVFVTGIATSAGVEAQRTAPTIMATMS